MSSSNLTTSPVGGTGLFDDNPDVDPPSCELLGPTALIVQGLMGVLVILSLVYKRHREKPMRPWRIWIFDVSKQVFGQMFVHGLNVLISGVISDATDGNACVSYFLNILIDTTLGVAVIYGVLHLLIFIFSEKMGLKGFESGVYGNPPSFKYWIRQAATYVCALTAMKFFVIGLFFLFPAIFTIGEWLLSWTRTGEGDTFQVIFVMGIFPIAMNILQFWLIDSIVKASSGPVALEADVEEIATAHPDREPLFNAPSDDEDDDDHHHRRLRRPGDLENQLDRHTDHSSLGSPTKSYATTGITTPDDDERKSLNYKPVTEEPVESHSYPPSLSNSFTSGSPSSSTKRTKRLSNSIPLSRSNSASGGSKTPPHITAHNTQSTSLTAKESGNEWAVTWGEEDDDDAWGRPDEPSEAPKQPGRGHGAGVMQPEPRARRLS